MSCEMSHNHRENPSAAVDKYVKYRKNKRQGEGKGSRMFE